jgi:glycosyltransferase involved in cell wall biosynthesis
VRHNYYPNGHIRRNAEDLARAGYDVSVVVLRRAGQPARESMNGVEIYRLPVEHVRGSVLRYLWEYGLFFLLASLTVAALHLRKSFRVVEVNNMPDVLVFSALFPRLTGARVIHYICDNMPELLMYKRKVGEDHPATRFLGWLQVVSARFADRVIVPTEATRRVVRNRGVPDDKFSVVLNGSEENILQRCPDRKEGREAGRFEIVTHSTILEHYGIQVLLDAMPTLIREIPEIHLNIYGDGEYRGALEAQAAALGILDRVHFHGWVPPDELPLRLYQADVGYAGVLYDLGLGNKLLEYVALRVPVVLARWPAHEDYFGEDAVTYFEPASVTDLVNAILAVYHDPASAAEKARRAAALYERYRPSEQRKIYLAMYDDLLGSLVAGTTEIPTNDPGASVPAA